MMTWSCSGFCCCVQDVCIAHKTSATHQRRRKLLIVNISQKAKSKLITPLDIKFTSFPQSAPSTRQIAIYANGNQIRKEERLHLGFLFSYSCAYSAEHFLSIRAWFSEQLRSSVFLKHQLWLELFAVFQEWKARLSLQMLLLEGDVRKLGQLLGRGNAENFLILLQGLQVVLSLIHI